MATNTRNTQRWQGLALAALIVAGTITGQQAAHAATVKSSSVECRAVGASCTLTVNARNDVHFRVASHWYGTSRYTVKTSGGRLLCGGTIDLNRGNRACWFGTYTGPVKITVSKSSLSFLRIYASY